MGIGALAMNLPSLIVALNAAVSTSFQTWTLLTMVQLRGLVRITSGR